jgi:NTE family protein
MTTVTFIPDRARRRSRDRTARDRTARDRTALVLGGGVRSMTSLDALSGTDVHDIYVLAPMASTEPDHPLQPHLRLERRLRQLLTRILLREDLAVMAANLMDSRRGQAVLETSFRTSAAALTSVRSDAA